MITTNDKFDLIEEIHLTEELLKAWLKLDLPACHFFRLGADLVALKDLCPCEDIPWELAPKDEVDRMITSSLARAGRYDECEMEILEHPREGPVPRRVRKMERHSEAVWTLFRHDILVIGLHDDGTIVARDIGTRSAHEFRVTPQGDFYCHGRAIDATALGNAVTAARVVKIRKGLQTWVQRGKGRKTPLGLQRLWRRLKKVMPVDLLWRYMRGPR